jgi:hypothetical protein
MLRSIILISKFKGSYCFGPSAAQSFRDEIKLSDLCRLISVSRCLGLHFSDINFRREFCAETEYYTTISIVNIMKEGIIS